MNISFYLHWVVNSSAQARIDKQSYEKISRYPNNTVMLTYLLIVMPQQEGDFLSGRLGRIEISIADAGSVGGFDGVGVVALLFREDDGEVQDLVCDIEFHQELDEVAEVFAVIVIAIVIVCFLCH